MTTPTAAEVVDDRDLTGQVVVVTGATSGIGLETARALAAAGAQLVLTGRDAGRLASAAEAVGEAGEMTPHRVLFDLADLAAVRAGAAEIAELVDRVDVLVNNAGVMFTPFGRTVQGHETQFGTNHLGHFLFTVLLEPLLRRAGTSRVVTLSSAGHRLADLDLDDVDWRRRDYDKFLAYGAAKTANLLFAVELDRRWSAYGVRSFAVHPGTVMTDLSRHMDKADMARMKELSAQVSTKSGEEPKRMWFATATEGAATSTWAAVSEELAGAGGFYLADCAVSADAAPYAVDPLRASRLWELSEQLVAAHR